MKRALAFSLLGAGLLACGCAQPSSDAAVAYLAESEAPIHGSTLASQFVDADSWYLGARSIAGLLAVEALDAHEESAAQRADGAFAQEAPNGQLGARELARLEAPEIWDTLAPEQKTAVPKLWSLLALDDHDSYASPCGIGADGLVEIVDDDQAARPRYALTVAGLWPQAAEVASAVQLHFDSDGDPTTITGWDVARAGAESHLFTPAQVGELWALWSAAVKSMQPPDPTLPRMLLRGADCAEPLPTEVFEVLFPEGSRSTELPHMLPVEHEATGAIRFPSYRTALRDGDQVIGVSLEAQPSPPDQWVAVVNTAESFLTESGWFAEVTHDPAARQTEVVIYAGGWAVVREDGVFVTGLAPCFTNEHNPGLDLFGRDPTLGIRHSDAGLWLRVLSSASRELVLAPAW